MRYRVLFLDIDGTILRDDHTYSELTKSSIEQIQKQGIEVFLATGRPIHELAELAEQLNVHSFIGYNGGYAIHQNNIIVNEPMDGKLIDHFLMISEQYGHEIVFYTSEKNYFTTLDRPVTKDFIKSFNLIQNERYTNKVREDILSITIMNVGEDEAKFYETKENIFLAQVNIDGLRHAYDVIQKDVNKGVAIKKVLKHLKIDQSQAIAFGDGLNDREMLEVVGEGFAMGNANPKLFSYAKHKTASVSEDGIYKGLKMLGLVK